MCVWSFSSAIDSREMFDKRREMRHVVVLTPAAIAISDLVSRGAPEN